MSKVTKVNPFNPPVGLPPLYNVVSGKEAYQNDSFFDQCGASVVSFSVWNSGQGDSFFVWQLLCDHIRCVEKEGRAGTTNPDIS